MTDKNAKKIAKLGIACSMWHTLSKAFFSDQQERFSFGEQNHSLVKNWGLFLDKDTSYAKELTQGTRDRDLDEHLKARIAYMVEKEKSNNDMTYMGYCNTNADAYTAGEILVEEGIAEHYEIIHDENSTWNPVDQCDVFDYDRNSFDFVLGMINMAENEVVLWLHLTQEGADFFRSRYEKEPKGMEGLS